MKTLRGALLRACLFASLPAAALAQAPPVIVEAESGSLGASLTTATAGGVTYVTTTENGTAPPATPPRIGTWQVTFPAAGNYDLYMRIQAGPNSGNDDSFYIPSGFNDTTNWTGLYNTSTGGYAAAGDTVLTGGGVGTSVWKWVRLTGSDGIGPSAWAVPADALTQAFSWASREDGLLLDKIAFGVQGVCYTVANLDNGTPPTGTCPPPPPPDPPPYTRTDPPIATGNAKYLGAAWSPGTASLNFANYWNQITPENGGKWGTVEGTRDVMNWAQADEAYALAKSHGFKFKWHTLVWGNQQPAWIAALTPEEQLAEIDEWYAAIAARYPDIDQIDVVNEPLHAPPVYLNALGGANGLYGTGWDWVIKSFEMARQYFPHAQLLINDYSITNDGNATTRYLQIIQLLKDRGLIDAIGDQVHAFSTTEAAPMPNHRANLDRLAATGLPIFGTEFDLDGVVSGVVNHEVQLANYQRVFPVFWEHPAVKGITIWGYVRGFHWRNAQGDWLLYPNGGERPALQWLIRYVQNVPATVSAGQSFPVNESAVAGTAIGNVLATDPDAATTLSLWQLTDPSGKFAIDANTGSLSLAAGATLDFETTTSYSVSVSVWDGYTRSASVPVTIQVTNANDNAPAVSAGQSFRIDQGYRQFIASIEVSDPDDVNQVGFTTFGGYKIVNGDPNQAFRLGGTGDLLVTARRIDWRRSSYTLGATVSDGANTSAVGTLEVTIPNKVFFCIGGIVQVQAAKPAAAALALLGADLGKCPFWR